MVALLIVCGDIESNPGPGSGRWVLVLYSSIRGFHENLDELAAVGSDYDVLVCAESKASNRRSPPLFLTLRVTTLVPFVALLPPTEAEEFHTWCPGHGSLC